MPSIRVGTSGWSYRDWVGPFYPPGTKPGDYLPFYAGRFDVVEVDSTFYAIPPARTVAGWAARTPDDFRFSVKTPQTITHEKVLVDCDADRDAFLAALEPLGRKLHSILLQFGYFNKKTFTGPTEFFDRLDNFLHRFPAAAPVAVEIRNRAWLTSAFFDLLRAHRAAFVLADQAWMPPPADVVARHDVVTGDFVYLRLIGDRKGIEQITQTWDRTVVDRSQPIRDLIRALEGVIPRADLVVFINNHYAGHAPASCEEFLQALQAARRPSGS